MVPCLLGPKAMSSFWVLMVQPHPYILESVSHRETPMGCAEYELTLISL